jgi:hypothetical protein
VLEDVSLSIVSREATNFSAQVPTLILISAQHVSQFYVSFTQIAWPEINTEHDLIYGSYKIIDAVNQDSSKDITQCYRSYSRINMEQLQADVKTQNCFAIFELTDPDEQLQHFNHITLWLLDLHAPLRRYLRRHPVNPWFTIDIERAMIKRNIAYRMWRRKKTTLDR